MVLGSMVEVIVYDDDCAVRGEMVEKRRRSTSGALYALLTNVHGSHFVEIDHKFQIWTVPEIKIFSGRSCIMPRGVQKSVT